MSGSAVRGLLRSVIIVVSALALCGPGIAQSPSDPAAPSTYDARSFLSAMIDLKRQAETCQPFVNNAPAAQMGGIDAFFVQLKQPLPDLTDTASRRSLNRVIKQHAAAICVVRLARAYNTYNLLAGRYQVGKPKDWPDAPEVPELAWCSTSDCSDVQ